MVWAERRWCWDKELNTHEEHHTLTVDAELSYLICTVNTLALALFFRKNPSSEEIWNIPSALESMLIEDDNMRILDNKLFQDMSEKWES